VLGNSEYCIFHHKYNQYQLYPFGLFAALVGAFIGSLGGLFFVVVFEIARQQSEKLEEIKKQTKLLEKIDEKLSSN